MIHLKKITRPPRSFVSLAGMFIILALCLVACGGPADPGTVTVHEGIESLSIATLPTRRGYSPNAKFSTTGLAVTANYNDGSRITVNSGYTLSWEGQTIADGNTDITAAPGMKTVSVSWQGKKTAFIIGVFSSTEITVTSGDEWATFLDYIGNNGANKSYIITVDGDFEVSTTRRLYANNLSVTIKGSGTISYTGKSQDYFLELGAASTTNQTLYLDGDVVLKGNPDNSSALVRVVWEGASFIMKRGTIKDNSGIGVYLWYGANFTMESGTIRDNSGGGVTTFGGGNFTMKGGTISHNSRGSGAGVYINYHPSYGSSFVKTGGIIYGNNAEDANKNTASMGNTYGHAVYFADNTAVYYRDTTLNETDDISTKGPLPAASGAEAGNWTRK